MCNEVSQGRVACCRVPVEPPGGRWPFSGVGGGADEGAARLRNSHDAGRRDRDRDRDRDRSRHGDREQRQGARDGDRERDSGGSGRDADRGRRRDDDDRGGQRRDGERERRETDRHERSGGERGDGASRRDEAPRSVYVYPRISGRLLTFVRLALFAQRCPGLSMAPLRISRRGTQVCLCLPCALDAEAAKPGACLAAGNVSGHGTRAVTSSVMPRDGTHAEGWLNVRRSDWRAPVGESARLRNVSTAARQGPHFSQVK
jgi:hypothetical protein